jgi:hypothetical protein
MAEIFDRACDIQATPTQRASQVLPRFRARPDPDSPRTDGRAARSSTGEANVVKSNT